MLPIFAAATALLLTACSEPEMRLAGERIDVLPEQVIETADAAAFAEGQGWELSSTSLPRLLSG